MKKTKLIVPFLCFFIFHGEAWCQKVIEYKLEKYKVKFAIPDNFRVLKNDDSAFFATDSVIRLSVLPKKGTEYRLSELTVRLKEIVDEKDIIKEGGYKSIYNLNGYSGVMVNGYLSETPVFLMLLVDPDYSDISLLFWVEYSEATIKVAKDILQSITPN